MKRFKRIYVEITNICNLSCTFCPKTTRAPRLMSPAEFQQIAVQAAEYTDYLYLHVMGEPLLHPQLDQLLTICDRQNLRVNLTTNGVLLKDKTKLLLQAKALRKVGISLHSFEANDTDRSLAAYLDGVLDFVKDAKESGIICELRLWNGDKGARSLNEQILLHIQSRLGIDPLELSGLQGSVKLAERLFLGFADAFDWPDKTGADQGNRLFCYGLRDQLGVLADGTVVPCCLDSEGTIALGNLLEQPLSEILEGERAKALYEGFSRRQAVEPLCRRCGYARRF